MSFPPSHTIDLPLLPKGNSSSSWFWNLALLSASISSLACMAYLQQPQGFLWARIAPTQTQPINTVSTPRHTTSDSSRYMGAAAKAQRPSSPRAAVNAEQSTLMPETGAVTIAKPLVLLSAVVTAFYFFSKPSTPATEVPKQPAKVVDASFARENLILSLQQDARRHQIMAEEQGARNFFVHAKRWLDKQQRPTPSVEFSLGAAAAPFLVPAAAAAHPEGAVAVTPDLVAGVMASAWMVERGQHVMALDGGASHGPPEAPHPLDVVELPYPETEDGNELAKVFQEPFDYWRESLIRYIAFASELGESFRPLVGDDIANATYIIAIGYVLADSFDKVVRASEVSRELSAAAVFMQMDTGLHGWLGHEELVDTANALKISVPDNEVDAFLDRTDIRRDNGMDFEEFYLALKRKDPVLLRFLEAGAATLPEGEAQPWKKALRESIDITDVRTLVAGMDALLWQMTASIAMPGFALNRIVTLAIALCATLRTSLDGAVDPNVLQLLNFIPTIVGLLSISVIVHPLDALADALFDLSIRKHVFKKAPVDRNGQLTLDIIAERVSSRPNEPVVPRELLQQMLVDIDTDNDGHISLSEWHKQGCERYERLIATVASEVRAPKRPRETLKTVPATSTASP